MNKLKIVKPIIHGLLQISFSGYWVFILGQLIANGHFKGMLFANIYPSWLLYLGFSLGIIGIIMGMLVGFKFIAISKGYYAILFLWLIGIFLEFIVVQIG